jgi:hypothetical protein
MEPMKSSEPGPIAIPEEIAAKRDGPDQNPESFQIDDRFRVVVSDSIMIECLVDGEWRPMPVQIAKATVLANGLQPPSPAARTVDEVTFLYWLVESLNRTNPANGQELKRTLMAKS